MEFRLTNTLTRQKEVLKITNPAVKIYSCGPTVYNFAHIGNFRSYLFADLLNRTLRLAGFSVEHAMNITDVDDKTIKGAQALFDKQPDQFASLKEALNAYTKPYVDAFFSDLQTLHVTQFNHYPRATEHIPDMLNLITKLIQKQHAYTQENSVYYRISEKKDYGKLSRLDLTQNKTGTRYNTDEYSKDDIRDFVLWKAESPDGVSWESAFGCGRPGWHIECSAMIHSIFGNGIDIHTGGVDLIFPHHENEIAQSESGYEGNFVKYWMHCEHLLVDNKKMSKSEGNYYTLRDILQKGYAPMAVRYLLLSAHYSQKLNFTLTALDQSVASLEKFQSIEKRAARIVERSGNADVDFQQKLSDARKQFLEELCDDLNTPRALAVVHETLRLINSALDANNDQLTSADKYAVRETLDYFDRVLGLSIDDAKTAIPEALTTLLTQRNEARKAKNFALADTLRNEIAAAGFRIVDDKNGSYLERVQQ